MRQEIERRTAELLQLEERAQLERIAGQPPQLGYMPQYSERPMTAVDDESPVDDSPRFVPDLVRSRQSAAFFCCIF